MKLWPFRRNKAKPQTTPTIPAPLNRDCSTCKQPIQAPGFEIAILAPLTVEEAGNCIYVKGGGIVDHCGGRKVYHLA